MGNAVPAPELVKSFEEIQPGDRATLRRTLTWDDVQSFARLTGDHNPLHVDEDYAAKTEVCRPVVHGMLLAGFVSTLVGMRLPGPGALWAEQRFRWKLPVFVEDEIRVELEVKYKSKGAKTLQLALSVFNQHGELVLEGTGVAASLAPALERSA